MTSIRYGLIAASVAALLALAATCARSETVQCVPAPVLTALIEIEAVALETEPLHLTDAGEIARYKAVIDEAPPASGPADHLVILPHPSVPFAVVFLINEGLSCERYRIHRDLHAKAWREARGIEI